MTTSFELIDQNMSYSPRSEDRNYLYLSPMQIGSTYNSAEDELAELEGLKLAFPEEPSYSSHQTVNPILLKKLADRQQTMSMVEITPDGAHKCIQMSLRELLVYINKEAISIDNNGAVSKNNRLSVSTSRLVISDI